ncbi:hypothetical protein BT69DRAFT_1290166 [Atractiella rhizophila]|nr:hypothetical protein BT69DRAFT_1290166 [Atractiella rhizophila]
MAEAPAKCRFTSATGLIVQGIMGVLVIGSLIFKRAREKPQRPWRIWSFDVSKQCLGQAFVHLSNLLLSDLLAHVQAASPCSLYVMNILIDTTLGVLIIWTFLRFSNFILTEKMQLTGFVSGQYGTPPRISWWFKQLVVYILAICTLKLIVTMMLASVPPLIDFGDWFIDLFPNEQLRLIVVLSLVPLTLNVLQFWFIDTIIKSSSPAFGLSNTPKLYDDADAEETEGFLRRDSLDEEEGAESQRRFSESGRRRGRSEDVYADEDVGRGVNGKRGDHSYPPPRIVIS